MDMCKFYIDLNKNGIKITHQLKNAWRWIKEVVKEWGEMKESREDRENEKKINNNEVRKNM